MESEFDRKLCDITTMVSDTLFIEDTIHYRECYLSNLDNIHCSEQVKDHGRGIQWLTKMLSKLVMHLAN